MKPVIVITQDHWNAAAKTSPRHFVFAEIANAALAIAEAEAQPDSSEYITAAQAEALGAGNAEWSYPDYDWTLCGEDCLYVEGIFKYRAIKQPEQAKPVAKKQVLWTDMPVGVAVKPKSDGRIWKFIGTTNMQHNVCVLDGVFLRHELPADIELAPADQQPWIAVQDEKDYGLDKVPGLVYLWRSNHSYRIVGLVDDTWEMV